MSTVEEKVAEVLAAHDLAGWRETRNENEAEGIAALYRPECSCGELLDARDRIGSLHAHQAAEVVKALDVDAAHTGVDPETAAALISIHRGTHLCMAATDRGSEWYGLHESEQVCPVVAALLGSATTETGDGEREATSEGQSTECCASGRCEVCDPTFDWGRDG